MGGSLLTTSHGQPVHLIFITESSNIATIARHVSDTLGKILLERILITSEALNPNRKKLPLLRVEFVSQASILRRHRHTIDHMRIHFDNHNQLMKLHQKEWPGWAFAPTSRYKYDMFYLSPLPPRLPADPPDRDGHRHRAEVQRGAAVQTVF